jgi:hypothetical protein
LRPAVNCNLTKWLSSAKRLLHILSRIQDLPDSLRSVIDLLRGCCKTMFHRKT